MNLESIISNNEAAIRLIFFFGILLIMALWELLSPRRQLTVSKTLRWSNNLALVFLNTLLLRLIFPAAAVGVAHAVEAKGWGLLNMMPMAEGIAVIVAVIILDLAIYAQHVLVHYVPLLWKLHRVHHADPDIDVTTGARFHPIEIIFSILIKFSVITVIGAPVVAVVIFEVLLNATAMFNHSNIKLPQTLDKIIRKLFVTPDMHRVHHSIEIDETNSNFGFNLSIWDRLFKTYRAQPREGHTKMTIGIPQFRDQKQTSWLPGMLMMPFK